MNPRMSAGFQIAVNHIDEQEDEVQFASRLCTELRPAGVIFLGGDMRNFKRSFARIKLPCILSTANAEELGFENLSSVIAFSEDIVFIKSIYSRSLELSV